MGSEAVSGKEEAGMKQEQGGWSIESGGTCFIKKATSEDVKLVAHLLRQASERSAEQSQQLLFFRHDTTTVQEHYEAVEKAIASQDQAFFLAGQKAGELRVVLQCRHMEGVPPVYDPGRSVLCLQSLYSSEAADLAVMGLQLVDAAVAWSKQLSQKGTLFVSSITWEHEQGRQLLLRQYHKASVLAGDKHYRDLFEIDGEPARMKPATHWYFGRSADILAALVKEQTSGVAVRPATERDISAMVELSKQKRHDYARYQPVFWRPAADAEQKQAGFFSWLLQQAQSVLLVSVAPDDTVDGFVVALPREGLPMVDPVLQMKNGLHIDDFALKTDALWRTAGPGLLASAIRAHQKRTGVEAVINVLSGTHDVSKRHFLQATCGMRSLYTWDILPSGTLYSEPQNIDTILP